MMCIVCHGFIVLIPPVFPLCRFIHLRCFDGISNFVKPLPGLCAPLPLRRSPPPTGAGHDSRGRLVRPLSGPRPWDEGGGGQGPQVHGEHREGLGGHCSSLSRSFSFSLTAVLFISWLSYMVVCVSVTCYYLYQYNILFYMLVCRRILELCLLTLWCVFCRCVTCWPVTITGTGHCTTSRRQEF